MVCAEQTTMEFYIDHIYSALPIGNTLAINMRQQSGAELDFVTFENETAVKFSLHNLCCYCGKMVTHVV